MLQAPEALGPAADRQQAPVWATAVLAPQFGMSQGAPIVWQHATSGEN